MRKNVWIFNHYAGDMFFSHGGRHYSFAKYLKRAGYEPVVFCCNAKHGKAESFFENENLWKLHIEEEISVPFVYVKARTYTGNGKQRILNIVDFYCNVKKAAQEYATINGKPDVIYASSVHPLTLVAGIQLAKIFNVRCICEVRDLWPESIVAYGIAGPHNPIVIFLRWLEKWIYKKADKIIMTWPGGYDYVSEQGWTKKIPAQKVVYISNGVDLESFKENARTNPYKDEDLNRMDKVKFVYTGSIRKVNNLGILIDTAKLLKKRGSEKALLLVFGDGDERKPLEALTLEKQLDNISFKGYVPKTCIPSILNQADVSILHNTSTSLDKYGQSQNKFFEYLAAGHPVLMTYSVGYSICKENKCGIELEGQTPVTIADAIDTFCNMSEGMYENYCYNASQIAKVYDFAELTKKLIKLIEEE